MGLSNFALNLPSMFTTPIALASIQTTKEVGKMTAEQVAQEVISGNFISDAVFGLLLPICWDIGKVLFAVGCIQGVYMLMRSDAKGFINKTKWATSGYILLRFIQVFITFIDTLAIGMCSKMGL